MSRAESDGRMEYITKQDNSKIIQGEFSLKNLVYFIKCTNLCNQIEMYIDNDFPLIVKYNVASLGEIKLCLAPLPSSGNSGMPAGEARRRSNQYASCAHNTQG